MVIHLHCAPGDKYRHQVSVTRLLPSVSGQRLHCQRRGGHSEPSLLPFVQYFRASDSFLIYLVNSRAGEEERDFLHYGNDGMGYNLPHIHQAQTLDPRDTVLHLAIVPVLFPGTVPPQWAKPALILSSFFWNDNVYQLSFNKEPGA